MANIKWWQIILFSMVPLALVFGGVIAGSFHGVDSSAEQITPVAIAPTPPPSGSPAPAGGVTVNLVAKNIQFDTKTITVPAGAEVTVVFHNEDAGVPHNFAVYTNSSATQKIFAGALTTGPQTVTYTFKAPTTPGNYFFRCDVHPDTMNGTFIVK